MYFTVFIQMRLVGIYQTSTVCPDLVSTVEASVSVSSACKGVFSRMLAAVFTSKQT